ncbi:hypothetical protein MKX01_000694 [Papaver californicum]|nr:hypothetical protein MKX01_000694 [Papaver californicum]
MYASILMSSHGLDFATAMVVSGTVIILAFCLPKLITVSVPEFPVKSDELQNLRCSEEKKIEKKKKKKVRFAEDVINPVGNSKDFRRYHKKSSSSLLILTKKTDQDSSRSQQGEGRGIPYNRIALYDGILRDRKHRMTYFPSS